MSLSNGFTCVPNEEYGPRSAFPVRGKRDKKELVRIMKIRVLCQ